MHNIIFCEKNKAGLLRFDLDNTDLVSNMQ